MGYDPHREKVHCFACGADYDLFDLLMLDENLFLKGTKVTKKQPPPKAKKKRSQTPLHLCQEKTQGISSTAPLLRQ